MWIIKGNKDILIGLLQQKNDIDYYKINAPQDLKKYTNKWEIIFCWENMPFLKGIPLPDVIICDSAESKEDFLAWVSVYINDIKPFTSYCRVINLNELTSFININKEAANSKNITNLFISLIICEAITDNYQNEKLTPLLAKSTYSYVFSQIALLGYHKNLTEELFNLYKRIDSTLPNFKRKSDKNDILIIWNIVSELFNNNTLYFQDHFTNKKEFLKFIFDASLEISEMNKISRKTWNSSPYNLPIIENFTIDFEQNTREFRVSIFEDIINSLLTDKSIEKNFISFIAAYLASQISPGSLKFSQLLLPYIDFLPSILLWYGFIAGLYKNSEINNYSDGFGWRILNSLIKRNSIFETPVCDISLDELEILRRSNPSYLRNIRTENNTFINIEIAPTILLPLELKIDNKNEKNSLSYNENNDKQFMSQIRLKIKELYDMSAGIENQQNKKINKKSKK